MKRATILVSSDHWAQSAQVVFDGEDFEAIYITPWVHEYLRNDQEAQEQLGDDSDLTESDAIEKLSKEFLSENEEVDECWPEYGILRVDSYYWRYHETGDAWYIGEFESIDEALQEAKL